MFKQFYLELRKCFGDMVEEYWKIREYYGVGLVNSRVMGLLPPDFVRARKDLLDGYAKEKIGRLNMYSPSAPYWKNLNHDQNESEIAEAMEVFISIQSQDDFKVFLDVFEWMPKKTHSGIMRCILSNQCISRLRELIEGAPMIEDLSSDLDKDCLLSASGNIEIFRDLILIIFSFPTKNEDGVTDLKLYRSENNRRELVQNMLKEIDKE